MEQKSLNLKQQVLQAAYELERLEKSYVLDQEEYKMGVKSKAQLEVARDEYEYKKKKYGFTTRGITARFYRDGDPERIDARRSRTRKEKICPGL